MSKAVNSVVLPIPAETPAKAPADAAAPELRPVRRRLRPEDRRELILDEALRLFAERHYSAVTVRDIAQSCAMNVALLYHYFAGKEDLVRRALEHAIGQLDRHYERQRDAALAPQADPLQPILAWLDAHVELIPTMMRMVRLMADYAGAGARDPALDALIAGFYSREAQVLEEAIAHGIAQGRFGPVDPAATARHIGLMLDGIFFGALPRGTERVADDIRALAARMPALLAMTESPAG